MPASAGAEFSELEPAVRQLQPLLLPVFDEPASLPLLASPLASTLV